jgi:protoheme IX farnesyltransferase
MADQPLAPTSPVLFATTPPQSLAPDAVGTARDLVSLAKPRLSLQVVVTAGGAMLLAPGHIDALRGIATLIATAMIVGAANALNCYIERDLDARMARTRNRALPAGRLAPGVAVAFAVALLVVALPMLALASNALTAALSVVALVSYVFVYTPLKQKSALALWVGAVPGAIPPLMGWTAVRGAIEPGGLVLFAILFCWQIPHFIAIGIYAQQDYARAGHRILPLVRSDLRVKIHAAVWCALLVVASLALVPLHIAGIAYGVAAAVLGAGFLGWTLTGFRPRTPERNAVWARGLFRASLAYVTLLTVALSVGAR